MPQNRRPISPGADYPIPQNGRPISPGADYPMPQNGRPISSGADYAIPQNGRTRFPGNDSPLPQIAGPSAQGPVYNGPVSNGPVFNSPSSNYRPAPNAPVYNGPVSNSPFSNYRPAPNGPVYNGPVSNQPAYKCGANEVYQGCGVGWQCEDYCGRGPNACAYCEDGCYCKPGYVRSGSEYTAECISENQCPRAQDVSVGFIENSGPAPVESTGYQCGPNERFQLCGVGWQCEDYCGSGPNACAYCEDGCYCQPGYVRSSSEYTAECIPENQCPRARDISPPIIENLGPRVQAGGPRFSQSARPRAQDVSVGFIENSGPRVQDDGPRFTQSARPRAQDESVGFLENSGPRAQDERVGFLENSGPGPKTQSAGPRPRSQDQSVGPIKNFGPRPRSQDQSVGPIKNFGPRPRPQDQKVGPIQNSGPRPRPQDQKVGPIENSGSPQCKINEVYNSCGGCDQFCNTEPISCKQDCSSPGCYCRSGFVRSFKGGSCIQRKDCPRPQAPRLGPLGPGPVKLPLDSKVRKEE